MSSIDLLEAPALEGPSNNEPGSHPLAIMTPHTSPSVSSSPAPAFLGALTCGVLGGLTAQILLQWRGIEIGTMWLMATSGGSLNGRVALSWWIIPGTALLIAMATGALMSGTALKGRSTRLLRWILGALLVYGLAEVGHGAEAPANVPAGIHLLSSFTALCLATVMAMLGAFFAIRR
jgi:hypothetical protein